MSVISNHLTLSKTNANFIESMLASPEKIASQKASIRSGRIPPIYENLRSFICPWPVIVGSKYKKDMSEVTAKIGSLLHKSNQLMAKHFPEFFKQQYKLPIAWFSDSPIKEGFGDTMLGRYDALVCRGKLRLVEYNAGSNIGGWHLCHLTELYRQVVGSSTKLEITEILPSYLFNLVRMAKSHLGEERVFNLLFEFENKEEMKEESVDLFTEVIQKYQLPLKVLYDIGFQSIQVAENEARLDGDRVDILCAPIFGVNEPQPQILQLLKLHQQNQILYPDNPVNLATGNKSCFANLYFLMQRNMLTTEEASLVSKYIPWSSHVVNQIGSQTMGTGQINLDNIIDNKSDYVLKRDGLLGGEQVFVGEFTPHEIWKNALKLASTSNGWIVQQYCPSDAFYAPTEDNAIVPHDYVFGFFDFGSSYGGAGVRLSPSELSKGVVNSAKGAQYTCLFEVQANTLVL